MSKYEILPVLKLEIEQLEQLIKCHDLTALKQSRAQLIREHNSLIRELAQIKNEDPEVYQLIYWHDLKQKDWYETYEKVCCGMYHAYPDDYCRKKINRYLKKHGLIDK